MNKILFISTEAAPYCRTGGTGDLVRGLSRELCVLGHSVKVILPYYYNMLEQPPTKRIITDLPVPLGAYERSGNLLKVIRSEGQKKEVSPDFYFVQQNFYFGRDDYYGYADDYERFIFFTRFTLEMFRHGFFEIEGGWSPDIIQGYDWPTGLIPQWLPSYRSADTHLGNTRFCMYIHNIRRMGIFGSRALQLAQLEDQGIFPNLEEEPERVNFLGRGILHADEVITVNPNYGPNNPLPAAAEVLRPALDLCDSQHRLHGIRGAIDKKDYQPAHDPALIGFSDDSLPQRLENKLRLQNRLAFRPDEKVPLIGMVGRAIEESGFDLLPALQELHDRLGFFQFVVLAIPGDPRYERMIEAWEAEQDQHNPWIKSRFLFDSTMTRQIYAGCDILLIPSKEQPAAIFQYIAMHYGAVPVVRDTGVLGTSIAQYQPGKKFRTYIEEGQGVGFKFSKFNGPALAEALTAALTLYQQPAWRDIQLHNMREDFSWDQPAGEYVDLYQLALEAQPEPVRPGIPFQLDPQQRLLQSLMEIDSLPGLAKREGLEILKQAARLVRQVLDCDAVYVSSVGEGLQLTSLEPHLSAAHIVERSFSPTHLADEPDRDKVDFFLSEASANIWKHLEDVDRQGFCQPILRLEQSTLAASQNWRAGWSTAIAAHSRLLGWINVFFTSPPKDPAWVISALSMLAGSVAQRMDTVRLTGIIDWVTQVSQQLNAAHSLEELEIQALKIVQLTTFADTCWLQDFSRNETVENRIGKAVADQAVISKDVLHIPDWNDSPRGPDGRRLFHSILVVPLCDYAANQRVISGVLVLLHRSTGFFNYDQVDLLKRLAPLFASALDSHGWYASREYRRAEQLEHLVKSLVVTGEEFDKAMERIVITTAGVLQAQASALYLLNPEGKLEIRAASGYQTEFLKNKTVYEFGEGLTGTIASTGRLVKANSLEELHQKEGWSGSKNRELGVPEPQNAFMGIPLTITDIDTGKSTVIGVLKFEERNPEHSSKVFTNEDEQLAQMMANIIAMVVYNTMRSETRLETFRSNLDSLSGVLAGSQDMNSLMNNIVETISKVLHADAASLYLADDKSEQLNIKAASGYQEPLVKAKAYYVWGEGVTGRIAQSGTPIKANSLSSLRVQGSEQGDKRRAGKYDHLHIDQKQPNSFYGIPLIVKQKTIGVLKVESLQDNYFTSEIEKLLDMMAGVITTVVYNAQLSEKRLQEFKLNLETLSGVLAGSQDIDSLMENIIDTISVVLRADGAALYLADEKNERLIIKAATGYQAPLVKANAEYYWGEGVTGRIAKTGKAVEANSLASLRAQGGEGQQKGKYDHLHVDQQQPNSFYGVPLIVKQQTIGVLKVESLQDNFFTNEIVRLIEMMAGVIAAVVYNAQLSNKQVGALRSNIENLSNAMARAQDITDLLNNVVKTTAQVLNAKASSLYLYDKATNLLVIQAATGYQETLVARRATYLPGEGITGWIYQNGEPVRAATLDDLKNHPAHRGKQDDAQGGTKPDSFLGLPLKVMDRETGKETVIGVLKVENIRPWEEHREAYFTKQDEALVTMMANVIGSVISNTRQGEDRVRAILSVLGTLSQPIDNSAFLLKEYAHSNDMSILDPLASALAARLDRTSNAAQEEAFQLFSASAKTVVYQRIADWSKNESVKWNFSLLSNVLTCFTNLKTWDQVLEIAQPWTDLKENMADAGSFSVSAAHIFDQIARTIEVHTQSQLTDPKEFLFGAVLETESILGEYLKYLPVIFVRRDVDKKELGGHLLAFAENTLRHVSSVLVLVDWNYTYTPEQMAEIQSQLLNVNALAVVYLRVSNILEVLASPDPRNKFRGIILPQITTVSPYVYSGPVPESMFFGREVEINTLVTQAQVTDYAIVGNRKIGKTSLLRQIYSLLSKQEMVRPLWVDCQSVITLDDFFNVFTRETDIELEEYSCDGFAKAIANLKKKGPIPVLLMDEVDHLLMTDRASGERLSSTWRTLSQGKICHFIFCGSGLSRLRDDGDSVFFNFSQIRPLRYLEVEPARQLITRPMDMLGIQLPERESLVNHIILLTSGHPSLIQYIGSKLVERVNKSGNRRIVMEDLFTLRNSNEFRETYLRFIWGAAGPFEKIITMVAPARHFDTDQLVEILPNWDVMIDSTLPSDHQPEVNDEDPTGSGKVRVSFSYLARSLALLDTYTILEKTGPNSYRFVPAAFQEILKETLDIPTEITVARLEWIQKIRKGEG